MKRGGGRRAQWQDTQVLARLVRTLADPAHPSKAAAARAAGISYPTLARWQAVRPELRAAWREGQHGRYVRRQDARRARAQQRPTRPGPTRQQKLVAWFLVHRVRLLETLTDAHVARACERVGLHVEAWEGACQRFPQLLRGVLAKRARRRAYLQAHGKIEDGWTPPDPRDGRTRAVGMGCWRWRRGTYLAHLYPHARRHSPRHGQFWL